MSTPGRPKSEYRSAQREGTPETSQIQIRPLARATSLPRRAGAEVVPAAREVRGDGR